MGLFSSVGNFLSGGPKGGIKNVVNTFKSIFTGKGATVTNEKVAKAIGPTGVKIVEGATSPVGILTTAAVGTVAVKGVQAVSAARASSATSGLIRPQPIAPTTKTPDSGLIKQPSSSGIKKSKTPKTKPNTDSGLIKTTVPEISNSNPLAKKNPVTASTPSVTSSTSKRRSSYTKKRTKTKRAKRKSYKRKSKKKRYGTAKQYKRKGGKSVKYTKNGQPYIIMASGKARFIKGKRRKK